MRVVNRNRVAEIPISKEYIDSEYITWEYKAYVQINSSYEVLGSTIVFVEAFDFNGDSVTKEDYLTPRVLEGIKDQAERLAMEKIESSDFDMEEERE